MPIRTHRGRAAVYRRLWGWPLRSPKHLIGAVLVLAVTASIVGVLLPEPPPQEERDHVSDVRSDRDVAQGGSVAGGSRDTPAPPTVSVPTEAPASVPPSDAGLTVVREWGERWTNHPAGLTAKQWLDRLRPYTTDEFITVMSTVDPVNVPATKVTGPPVPRESTKTSMRVVLPTDGGKLRIHVVRTSEGWRVAGYDKAA